MNSLNHGRFQQQIRFLRQQFLQDGNLPFAKVLSSASIAKVVESTGLNWRERIFSPIVTLWAFLGQVLSADNSCRAAVARLNAHRVAVVAWAMLCDDKEWDPSMMIQVTESFGKMSPCLKEALQTMKPKENSDQRESRLRKEARAAKDTAIKDPVAKPTTQVEAKAKRRTSTTKSTQTIHKNGRARKLVSGSDA